MSTTRILIVVAVFLFSARDAVAQPFRVASSVALPDGSTARDVRWAGPSEVFVSLGRDGIGRTSVRESGDMVRIMTAADRAAFPSVGLVGAGPDHLFVASQMGRSIASLPLDRRKGSVSHRSLLALMDIDARGDRAALLGADSGPLQGLARDGVIAWTGSLSKGMKAMRPLMTGRSKPGGKDMARCSILELGAIRFMQDGSLVVVPGVEPGVYRYDTGGKLIQTWDTGPLGIVDDCAMKEEELLLVARDFEERIRWYASRVIVDDVLPLRAGPALLLRRVEGTATKWDLLILSGRGKPQRVALPVSVASPRAHARGDVRGDEVVLLLFDDPLPQRKPVSPPRLVVLAAER